MPASALHHADSLMTNVDSALRTVGYDLPSLIKSVDLKTVGLVTGAVILGLLLFDVITQWFGGSYANDVSSYSTYGRSLAVSAAKVWDQKDELGLLEGVRGGRSIEPMTKILDSLSEAILKWDETEPKQQQQQQQQTQQVQQVATKQDLKNMPRKSKVLFQ